MQYFCYFRWCDLSSKETTQSRKVNNFLYYKLKQWIALKSRCDWLFKLKISYALHLRATCAGFALENIVIVAGINELKSSSCTIFSLCFSIYENNYASQCRWLVLDVYRAANVQPYVYVYVNPIIFDAPCCVSDMHLGRVFRDSVSVNSGLTSIKTHRLSWDLIRFRIDVASNNSLALSGAHLERATSIQRL